jgi:hypothetical protein
VSNTLHFNHRYITTPAFNPTDATLKAESKLTAAIKGTPTSGQTTDAALNQVAELFTKIAEDKRQAEAEASTHHPPRMEAPLPRVPRNEQIVASQIVALQQTVETVESPPPEDATQRAVLCTAKEAPPMFLEAQASPMPHAVQPDMQPHAPCPPYQYVPYFITQDKETEMALQYEHIVANTQSKTQLRTLTQEAMLSCIKLSQTIVTPLQLARCKFPMQLLCNMANAIIDTNGELLQYQHLMARLEYKEIWGHSYGNKIGRLAQGMPGRAEGTNTIFFIPKSSIPHDRIKEETYTQLTVLYRPEKDKPNRTRLVVGGNRINYPGNCGTPTADLLTVKLLLNSIVSTLNEKFFTMDIKDFYLNTPLKRYEYICLKLSDIPADIITHYNLMDIAIPEGHVHCKVR